MTGPQQPAQENTGHRETANSHDAPASVHAGFSVDDSYTPSTSVTDYLDAARRDSYYKQSAVYLGKQVAHMYGRLADEQEVTARQRVRIDELGREVIDWMELSAKFGCETTAERTKRFTLKGNVEIAAEMLMDDARASEVIRFVCVDLHKRLLAESKPKRREHASPTADPEVLLARTMLDGRDSVGPAAGAAKPATDAAADVSHETPEISP